MSFERFEAIVEIAKEQELEVGNLKNEVKELKAKLEESKAEMRLIDGIKIEESKFGPRPRDTDKDVNHSDLTMGIKGLTSKPDLNGKIMAKVHFVHPVTGRDTTKSAVRPTLLEAIIARNEIAATLLRGGLIDLEVFKRYTSF